MYIFWLNHFLLISFTGWKRIRHGSLRRCGKFEDCHGSMGPWFFWSHQATTWFQAEDRPWSGSRWMWRTSLPCWIWLVWLEVRSALSRHPLLLLSSLATVFAAKFVMVTQTTPLLLTPGRHLSMLGSSHMQMILKEDYFAVLCLSGWVVSATYT
jgi:hypothetical protein